MKRQQLWKYIKSTDDQLFEVNHLISRRMFQQRLSAMPIVNNEGQLVATLSPSDLRGMTCDKLNTLLLPVPLFLQEMQGKRMIVACSPDTHVNQVMAMALKEKVHRVRYKDKLTNIGVGSGQ